MNNLSEGVNEGFGTIDLSWLDRSQELHVPTFTPNDSPREEDTIPFPSPVPPLAPAAVTSGVPQKRRRKSLLDMQVEEHEKRMEILQQEDRNAKLKEKLLKLKIKIAQRELDNDMD